MAKIHKIFVSILVCTLLFFSRVCVSYATTLDCWYSDSNNIGKWTYSPKVWYSKIDTSGSFAMLAGLNNGKSIWNSALGLDVSVSSLYTSAPIKYYGGTKAQIDALNLFNPVATTTLGMTQVSYSLNETCSYNGASKKIYICNSVRGYIVSRTDMSYNNYLKTASHEMGHALGWLGHPATNQPTWVMQQGILTNTILNSSEKRHLAQVY